MSTTAIVSPAPSSPLPLPPLSAALAMLAEADTVEEVKELRDQAEAVRQLLKARKDSLERQNDAAEIKLLAECKLGDLLGDITPRGRCLRDVITGQMRGATRTLPDGITAILSYRCQRMAALPKAKRNKWIHETRAAGEELTQKGLLDLAEQHIREELVKLNLNCGGSSANGSTDEHGTDSNDGTDDLNPSYTRPVMLMFTVAERDEFLSHCAMLADDYGTTTVTATVAECARRAAEDIA
jgi:hypothetical protein